METFGEVKTLPLEESRVDVIQPLEVSSKYVLPLEQACDAATPPLEELCDIDIEAPMEEYVAVESLETFVAVEPPEKTSKADSDKPV